MRNAFGQCRLYLVHQFLVQHVAFGDGKHALLVQHFGVEGAELVQEYVVLLTDVVAVGRHHEQQQGVALDVSQEAQSQSFARTGSFDDAGNVRHHKRFAVAIGHDAQIGFQRCKRIIGDFGLRRRNGCQ